MPKSTLPAGVGRDPKETQHTHANDPSAFELATVAEAATLLKISQSGVRRLQHARQLPFIKIGASVRFSTSDLISYVAKRRVAALND